MEIALFRPPTEVLPKAVLPGEVLPREVSEAVALCRDASLDRKPAGGLIVDEPAPEVAERVGVAEAAGEAKVEPEPQAAALARGIAVEIGEDRRTVLVLAVLAVPAPRELGGTPAPVTAEKPLVPAATPEAPGTVIPAAPLNVASGVNQLPAIAVSLPAGIPAAPAVTGETAAAATGEATGGPTGEAAIASPAIPAGTAGTAPIAEPPTSLVKAIAACPCITSRSEFFP